MSDVYFELQEQLTPVLRSGDLSKCERTVATRLANLERTPFHVILDLVITNRPTEVAKFFDEFFHRQPTGRIKAAYTEMNGFEINPDLWFCTPFAYERYGGHDDYDWLSDWQSEDFANLSIRGLEALQSVFASDAFRDERFEDACSMTSLLVVIRFQDLIRKAASHMEELDFPLLATAHDSDFIYEVRRHD